MFMQPRRAAHRIATHCSAIAPAIAHASGQQPICALRAQAHGQMLISMLENSNAILSMAEGTQWIDLEISGAVFSLLPKSYPKHKTA